MYTCACVTPGATAGASSTSQSAYYAAPGSYYTVASDSMGGSYAPPPAVAPQPAPTSTSTFYGAGPTATTSSYADIPPPSPPHKGYGGYEYYPSADPYGQPFAPPQPQQPTYGSGYTSIPLAPRAPSPPPYSAYTPSSAYPPTVQAARPYDIPYAPMPAQYPPPPPVSGGSPTAGGGLQPIFHSRDPAYHPEHPAFGQISPLDQPARRAAPVPAGAGSRTRRPRGDVIPALGPAPIRIKSGKSEWELEAKPVREYAERSFSPSRGPGLTQSQLRAKEKQQQSSPNAKSEMAQTAVTMKSDWSRHTATKPRSMQSRGHMENNFLGAVTGPKSVVSGAGGAMTILDDDGRSMRFVKPDRDDEGALLTKNTRIDPPPPGPPLPPSDPLPCALVDAVLMLRISDQNKLPTNRRTLDLIMCGTALMQLVISQKVEAHPNTIRYPAELKLRAIDTRSADDQYADEILGRLANNRSRTVAEIMDYMFHQFEGLTSKVVNRLVCMGWLHYEPYSQGNPERYYVINTKVHSILRNRVVNLMNVRDENGQAPLVDSILAAMYWMPRDFTDYAFGGSLEGYEASQICKAILYQVRNFLDAPVASSR